MAGGEHRIASIVIDERSLAATTREAEHDRQVAIFDLLEQNLFQPEGAPGGPYDVALSLIDGRLAFDIGSPLVDGARAFEKRHLLSLTPFRSLIRDYFLHCDSYYAAIRNASPAQIEVLDMGRRGLHNQGSELLIERLDGKVRTDLDTARRLFTLICALYRRP
jgi:uncharacterized protein (UPF0262 family)